MINFLECFADSSPFKCTETDAADSLSGDKFIAPLFIDYEGVNLFHNHAVYRSSVVDLLICHWPPDTVILEGIWLLLSELSSKTFDYNNQIQQPSNILPEPYVLFMRQFSVPIENILLRILKFKKEAGTENYPITDNAQTSQCSKYSELFFYVSEKHLDKVRRRILSFHDCDTARNN